MLIQSAKKACERDPQIHDEPDMLCAQLTLLFQINYIALCCARSWPHGQSKDLSPNQWETESRSTRQSEAMLEIFILECECSFERMLGNIILVPGAQGV